MSRAIKVWKSWGEIEFCFAIVDNEDYERVKNHGETHGGWQANRSKTSTYAATVSERYVPTVAMHRFILGLDRGEGVVDHINGNGLDNRKVNLRGANPTLNSANRRKRKNCQSKYKGVTFNRGRIVAQIFHRVDGRRYKDALGVFETEEQAARVYDRRAIELWGEYAKTNFPRSDYETA